MLLYSESDKKNFLRFLFSSLLRCKGTSRAQNLNIVYKSLALGVNMNNLALGVNMNNLALWSFNQSWRSYYSCTFTKLRNQCALKLEL